MPDTPDRPRLALIAGPTASGKSAMAMALAEREDGVVLNADASQVYRDLRVVTARPSVADETRVPHRLYGHVDAGDAHSAAAWAREAASAVEAVAADGRLPILVGGTGLYLRALLEGIAPVPPIDPDVRAGVRSLDAAAAHEALLREDPDAAVRLHPRDAARNHRALETIRSTGRGILAWRTARVGGITARYRLAVTVTRPTAAEAAAACDARVAAMMDAGAVEEVRALLARGLDPSLPAMRAIGVPQIAAFIAGETTRAAATEAMRRATRQYAKRQRTWFAHQPLGNG